MYIVKRFVGSTHCGVKYSLWWWYPRPKHIGENCKGNKYDVLR